MWVNGKSLALRNYQITTSSTSMAALYLPWHNMNLTHLQLQQVSGQPPRLHCHTHKNQTWKLIDSVSHLDRLLKHSIAMLVDLEYQRLISWNHSSYGWLMIPFIQPNFSWIFAKCESWIISHYALCWLYRRWGIPIEVKEERQESNNAHTLSNEQWLGERIDCPVFLLFIG